MRRRLHLDQERLAERRAQRAAARAHLEEPFEAAFAHVCASFPSEHRGVDISCLSYTQTGGAGSGQRLEQTGKSL